MATLYCDALAARSTGLRFAPIYMLLMAVGAIIAAFTINVFESGGAAMPFSPPAVSRHRPLYGVAVHLGQNNPAYALEPTVRSYRFLGFDSFRDDFRWVVPATASDPLRERVLRFMDEVSAQPVLIASTERPGVVPSDLIERREVRTAYLGAAFQSALLLGRRGYLEVGNEWNLYHEPRSPRVVGAGAPGDPRSASAYAELAIDIAAALRRSSRSAPLLVGAVGEDPNWSWTLAMVRSGGLEGAAGLSVHLYNQCQAARSRSAEEATARVEELRRQLVELGKGDTKVFVSEVGWPTIENARCGVSLRRQADNLAQMLLWSSAQPWIGGVWIYELKDEGVDPTNQEHHFGLFDLSDRPKPAACAVRETLALIASTREARLTRYRDFSVLEQTTGAGRRYLLWAAEGRPAIPVAAGRAVFAKSICGAARTKKTFAITSTPTIVTLPGQPGRGLLHVGNVTI